MNIDWWYFAALGAGIFAGLIWRRLLFDSVDPASDPIAKGRARAKILDVLSIRVLLPFHVAFTFLYLKSLEHLDSSLYVAAASGCALGSLTYLAAKLFWKTSYPAAFPLIAGSFGGGNRGVLLLTTVVLFQLPEHARDRASVFDIFSIMDTAYFLFFTQVVLRFSAKGRMPCWETLLAVVGAAIIISGFIARNVPGLHEWTIAWLAEIGVENPRRWISFAIAFAAPISVFLRFENPNKFRSFDVIGSAILVRFFFLACLAVGCWLLLVPNYLDGLALASLYLVYFVFLLVPPSSFASGILQRQANRSEKDVGIESEVQIVWNALFLSIVLVILVFGLIRQIPY